MKKIPVHVMFVYSANALQKLNQIEYNCKIFKAPFEFSYKVNAKCMPLQHPLFGTDKKHAQRTVL